MVRMSVEKNLRVLWKAKQELDAEALALYTLLSPKLIKSTRKRVFIFGTLNNDEKVWHKGKKMRKYRKFLQLLVDNVLRNIANTLKSASDWPGI